MEDVNMAKFCKNCGSEIKEGSLYCEKCGSPVDSAPVVNQALTTYPSQPTYQGVPNKTNSLAIAGFIVSLVSLVCCTPAAVISLILSIIGLNESKKCANEGKGLAIAGIVISAIALLFLILIICIYAIGIFSIYDTPYYY